MKHVLQFCILVLCSALLLASQALAGPGKIAGKVTDPSGEGVIGAAVQVLETQQGAPVDIEGDYVILGVEPGTYSIRVTCIGYTSQTFKDVRVSSDLTITLNVKLSEEAIGIEEQIIEYQAPAVKVDVAQKEVRITGKEMETRAVTNITGLLLKQPGFKVDPEGAMHVRGGRSSDMLVKVDGVDFRDPLITSSRQILNMSALNVEEIEVLTGGDASYGGFQSAVVNVSTKEGSMRNYGGILEYRTDRMFKSNSIGERNPNWNTDQYDYSLSGPVPFADDFLGKEKLSFYTSGAARLTNTYTPYGIQRKPSDYLGLGFRIPERQANEFSTFWKFTYRMDPNKKFNLTFQRDYSLWDIYPEGEAAMNANYGWQYKYNVENRPYTETSRRLFSLAFSHNLTKDTWYEVTVSNFTTSTKVLPRGKNPDEFTLSDDREDDNRLFAGSVDNDRNGYFDGYLDADGNGLYDGWGEGYDDVNRNGQWDRGEDWVDLNGNGVYDDAEPWVDLPHPVTGQNNLGVYDPWDRYDDVNGNDRWDAAEPQLPEQDWNRNGLWDGERFQDANRNGIYDGEGEGYDDKNLSGSIDRRNLFDPDTDDQSEPFVDGDFWYDTGEPFQDLPDTNGYYNGIWDPWETWWDLPSSFSGPYGGRNVPTTNGVYDGPNGVFDEYELFTHPNWKIEDDRTYYSYHGMDPRYPVIYTYGDLLSGDPDAAQGWLALPSQQVDGYNYPVPGYLIKINGVSTWDNRTLHDMNGTQVFDMRNNQWDNGRETFSDYNQNRVQDDLPDLFLNPGQWDNQAFWMDRTSREWSAKFTLKSQASKYHELQSGFEVKSRDLKMNSIQEPDQLYTNTDVRLPDDAPFYGRGGTRDFYHHQPWEGSLYFQDKMEFEGMILRAGIRADFVLQPNDLLEETQNQLDRNQPGAILAERGKFALSPRLGISYPITSKSKLYFNYGHFLQTPAFEYYYRSATANPSPNTQIGNPNLDYEKTVSYEVGVNTEFTEDWVVDVAGYYRDEFDRIGTTAQSDGPLTLNRYFNLGYGRARGFEFSVKKNPSNLWALQLNYDYSYAFGKESAATEGLRQRAQLNVPENRDEHPLDWDQTHTFSTYLTIAAGEKDKPRLFGLRLPSDWYATFEFIYGSGYPYTPSQYIAQKPTNLILANSARFPATATADLKFDKFWKIAKGIKLATGFEIYNLFNRKDIRQIYPETGNAHDSSHELNQEELPDDNQGTDYDHNPRNYSAPRHILLHFRIQF
ncbi:TonB-dependent receptor [bacterium]|nr:TonB-dependent receptor [bacterium]